MLSCRKASHLVSESLDRPLSTSERFRLRAHLLICTYCRRLVRHLRLLQRLGEREDWSEWTEAGQQLSPEARERLELAIKGSEQE